MQILFFLLKIDLHIIKFTFDRNIWVCHFLSVQGCTFFRGQICIDIDGIFSQLTGPSYESPAEIRMLADYADAVGMSTVVEAIAANHCGLRVCGISCICNLAAGMNPTPLSHKEVQETADRVAKDFERLVTEIIKNI